MKKLLFTIMLLLITAPLYATREFYIPDMNMRVSDVSNTKTINDIRNQYNISKDTVIQDITQDLENKKAQTKLDNIANKQAKQKPAIDKLKKLGWTDNEINALLEQ